MDIVTHAGLGLVAASPFLADQPELALGVVAGSVLPDLDALCRLVDKQAFLRGHQTWSHALPVQLVFSFGSAAAAVLCGWRGVELGLGLMAGLFGHTLLDLSNTFGVAWFMPFSRRRFCLEWVFFIDEVILAAVTFGLTQVVPRILRDEQVPLGYAAAVLAFFFVYVLGKGMLRRRAGKFCPTGNLVPSALVPWRFFGTARESGAITLFRANALTGTQASVAKVPLLDESSARMLEVLPEFRLMREVSPEYHVVGASAEGTETRLLCRDMRTRNFGSRFGDLEVWLDANRRIIRSRFHA